MDLCPRYCPWVRPSMGVGHGRDEMDVGVRSLNCVWQGEKTGDLTAAGSPGKTHAAFHNFTPDNARQVRQAAQVP